MALSHNEGASSFLKMILRYTIAFCLFTQISNAETLVDWSFKEIEDKPHLTPLKGVTVVNQSHAKILPRISVSDLIGGGCLSFSTYNTQKNSLNVVNFKQLNGAQGYLEFTITSKSSQVINLEKICIEAMRNGEAAPRALQVSVSSDGASFMTPTQPKLFPIQTFDTFNTLYFDAPLVFTNKATVRIHSASPSQFSGNLHIRKLSISAHTEPLSQQESVAETEQHKPEELAAIICIGGISVNLKQ